LINGSLIRRNLIPFHLSGAHEPLVPLFNSFQPSRLSHDHLHAGGTLSRQKRRFGYATSITAMPMRVAHILCELHACMQMVGLVGDDHLPLPPTQMDLADAAGLTALHINRTFSACASTVFLHFKRRSP
jgi:hypothetical protein